MPTSATTQAGPAAADSRSATPAIRATALCKVIDDKRILHDIDFEIPQGRYVALLGANGAGKSTLLKVLATLIPPSHGELSLFGQILRRETSAVRSRLGMIGHNAMLYRDLTAGENLIFFGKLYRVEDPEKRAAELLDYVDLASRRHDPVKTFSRGMTQRVAIARALMHDPDLLLADEPFAGLDAPSSAMLQQMLNRLHEAGKTIILANHDIGQSLALAEHAIVLRKGCLVIDQQTKDLDADGVMAEVSNS